MKIDIKVLRLIPFVSQLAIYMIVPIVICIFIGVKLENHFNTSGILLIVFTILGMLSAFRNLYVLVMRMVNSGNDKK